MMRRKKNTFRMLSSLLLVQTVWFWHFCVVLMTKKSWKAAICVPFCISIRHWHRLRSPLSKKLNEGATKVFEQLSKKWNCEYDDRGNIGKRYRRQDEIGTPFCVTYDFDSEEDGAVTVRDRDTMEQERIKIEDLAAYFEEKLAY